MLAVLSKGALGEKRHFLSHNSPPCACSQGTQQPSLLCKVSSSLRCCNLKPSVHRTLRSHKEEKSATYLSPSTPHLVLSHKHTKGKCPPHPSPKHKNSSFWGWRGGSGVKHTCCSCRRPGLGSQSHAVVHGRPELSFLGPPSSSGLHGQTLCAYGADTRTHARTQTHTHKITLNPTTETTQLPSDAQSHAGSPAGRPAACL